MAPFVARMAPSPPTVLLTREQKINDLSYHHYYSLVPSGGLRATEGKTCDTSESEAVCTQVHKASTLSP
jgi:hypothetical protein